MMVNEVRDVPLAEWVTVLTQLRDEGFTMFDWMTAVDATDAADDPGFDLTCHVVNVEQPALPSIIVRTRVPLDPAGGTHAPTAASVTSVFAGAAWHERETHEMFGIDFEGFDDGTGLGLRPLLLPDGFEGTPLRKSFVLAARAAKPWPGGKEPGEGHESAKAPGRRRVQAPGVPGPDWGPR